MILIGLPGKLCAGARLQDAESAKNAATRLAFMIPAYSRYDGSIESSFLIRAGHSRMPSLRRTPGW